MGQGFLTSISLFPYLPAVNIFEHYFIQNNMLFIFVSYTRCSELVKQGLIVYSKGFLCICDFFLNRCSVNATPQQLSQTEQSVAAFLGSLGRRTREPAARAHVVQVRAGPCRACVWALMSPSPVRREREGSVQPS